MTAETSPDPTSEGFAAAVALISGAHVLIVDDEPRQCAYLARSVQDWGGVPFEARAFDEALRIHRETTPDIVLLDVVMPDVDGFKLAQMFKKIAPFVPVILLTALDDLASKRRAHAAGADELLTKPVNLVELQIRIASMLRIKRLADELATANKHLSAMAAVDPLTQVANRRALAERLAHEFARSRRYHQALSCLLIDIDHFKRVNDDLGHPMGDNVLVAVAASLDEEVRETDFVGRYGGEEFLVLAPGTPAESAKVLGERLRSRVASLFNAKPAFPRVTVSIGIASTELDVQSADDLVARADASLYAAKGGGRNCVVVAL